MVDESDVGWRRLRGVCRSMILEEYHGEGTVEGRGKRG